MPIFHTVLKWLFMAAALGLNTTPAWAHTTSHAHDRTLTYLIAHGNGDGSWGAENDNVRDTIAVLDDAFYQYGILFYGVPTGLENFNSNAPDSLMRTRHDSTLNEQGLTVENSLTHLQTAKNESEQASALNDMHTLLTISRAHFSEDPIGIPQLPIWTDRIAWKTPHSIMQAFIAVGKGV